MLRNYSQLKIMNQDEMSSSSLIRRFIRRDLSFKRGSGGGCVVEGLAPAQTVMVRARVTQNDLTSPWTTSSIRTKGQFHKVSQMSEKKSTTELSRTKFPSK